LPSLHNPKTGRFVSATPDRALQQRRDAIQIALYVRTFRKNLKLDLKTGRRNIVDVLLEPPAELENMKLLDLLLAVPKIGRVKADHVLRCSRISTSRTIGELTQRQRTQLISRMYR
jgi:hypothetical protein